MYVNNDINEYLLSSVLEEDYDNNNNLSNNDISV